MARAAWISGSAGIGGFDADFAGLPVNGSGGVFEMKLPSGGEEAVEEISSETVVALDDAKGAVAFDGFLSLLLFAERGGADDARRRLR